MCGIFGIIAGPKARLDGGQAERMLRDLFLLSETRGKESSGIAVYDGLGYVIRVTKDDVPASELVRSPAYAAFLRDGLAGIGKGRPIAVIAHSRLVTNGTQEHNTNNQPVIKDGVVMVHNGIVCNVDALWAKHRPEIQRAYEVDTEVIAARYRSGLRQGLGPAEAIKGFFGELEGAASVAILADDIGQVMLATNTGSLYYLSDEAAQLFVFASEEYILRTFRDSDAHKAMIGHLPVTWLEPFTGLVIAQEEHDIDPFTFGARGLTPVEQIPAIDRPKAAVVDQSSPSRGTPAVVNAGQAQALEALLEYPLERIRGLKRCTKCLLPETFPFISFDAKGECNYCTSYRVKGLKVDRRPEFREVLQKYRRNDGRPDCIVAFSGGRDSSYGLHLLVEEFGMKPLTFTYDWGMVTDLARRNIARMTGKLGVENILVSADIKRKRENIRLNVEAWLKQPRLGMIPLFMAGDKHFFVHVNNIRRQTGIACDIWMENKLENTDFKAGFAGIKPNFTKERIDRQSTLAKLQMPLYYMRNFLGNPGYLNASLPDTFSAYKAYYLEPREVYLLLFDYIPWDERNIDRTLIEGYNWEISPDTTSTWRIGDGTAAFYNYIYCTVAGFTEFDTFRSNQIREGMLGREEALRLVEVENRPRFETLKWYFDTIGVDMERAIRVINALPRLYSKRAA